MDMPTFDELKELARRDPEGFEVLRAKLIDDFIRQSPRRLQRRLRGRQFAIEARRRLAGSPMKALLDMQAMMYDSLLGLQQTLRGQKPPSESSAPRETHILPFRRRSSSED